MVIMSPGYKREQLPNVKTPYAQEFLERTITATDRQMDQPDCGLHGLTEDDIRVVEGNGQ